MLVDIIYHSKNPSLRLLQQFRLNLTLKRLNIELTYMYFQFN